MLERTMKSFGAAVVFLALNNLLTVSSDTSTVANLQTPDVHASSSVSPQHTAHSSTEPQKDETEPTTGSTLSTNTEKVLSTSTLRSIISGNEIDSTASTVDSTSAHTKDDLNKDAQNYTSAPGKNSTESPQEEKPSINATTASTHVQVLQKEEASTEPSRETQTTKPAITNKVQALEIAEKDSIGEKKAPEPMDNSNSIGDKKKTSDTSNRGIKIGVGCVAAVIAVIVLVVIYKMCQKKPPVPENTGVKMSTETKENVKLLSVKTEAPNSDTKRSSSNQMESIEC